ncbi:hypothetical protein SDC9_191102 [bioreactor metagenome]|uniref:Uncharacterized protein n=1 Tax=bioreactor metagenome TaxID=1076179 RepID=A0A645HYH0_9ZZZZ
MEGQRKGFRVFGVRRLNRGKVAVRLRLFFHDGYIFYPNAMQDGLHRNTARPMQGRVHQLELLTFFPHKFLVQ